MNRKSLVFLLLGFSLLLQAQSIRKYEYWFDHDTDGKTVMESSSEEIALQLDVKAFSPGVHVFNFRAEDDKGQWSVPLSSFFIRTQEVLAENRMKNYEYWIDGQTATKQTIESSTGVINLNLDVSSLSVGIHTFTLRAQDIRNQWSAPQTYYFIKAEEKKGATRLECYEYWLDLDYNQKKVVENTDGLAFFDLDVSSLSTGVHVLSFRMNDNRGYWSSPVNHYFVKPEKKLVGDNKILGYQYWYNNETDKATYIRLPEPASPAIVDVELPVSDIKTTVTPENITLVKANDGKYKIGVKNVIYTRFKDATLRWSTIQADTFETVVSGSNVNLTPFIVNPDANDYSNGWAIENGGIDLRSDENWSSSNANYFHLNGSDVTMRQTISGLPAGTYALSAMGRASSSTELTINAAGFNSAAFKADDTTWEQNSVIFTTNGEPFDIEIKSTGGNWADIDNLQLDFNSTASLKVELAATAQEMEHYKDMRLVLSSSQTQLALSTTNARSYTFHGLSSNAVYRLSLQNRYGQEFARRDNININEGDNTLTLDGLKSVQQVNIAVLDSLGQDVTTKTNIVWTDEQGKYIASGANIASVPEGITMGYEVNLGNELGATYIEQGRLPYTVATSNNNFTMQLQPIAMTTITGRVLNEYGTVYGANVSVQQWLNGHHTKTFNATTGTDGTFTLQVYNDSSVVVVGYNGYLNATMHRSDFAETNIGDITLQPVSGVVITPEIAYQSATREGAYWTDGLNNIDFSIQNGTTGQTVTDFVVQNDRLIVTNGLKAGDQATLTAKSRKGIFADVSLPITVAESDSVEVQLNLVELGGFTATYRVSNNENNIGCLYDENGQLVQRGSYSYREFSLTHLAAGDYTLVTMGKSQMLGNILSYADLLTAGMQEGRDFITSTISICDGVTTEVSVDSIPTMEESRFYYTNQNTHFEANKTSLTVGNYVTLSSRIGFKEEFADKINDVSLQVELPSGCELVPNSVIIGKTLASYTNNNGRIIIPISQTDTNERIRFCITPTESGDYTTTAFVAFSLDDDVLQPIGSALFTAEDISITAPNLIANTEFGVSGTCTPYSSVEVYDGINRIGATTSKADGSWFAKAELDEPINLSMHDIHALISTPANVELKTETRRLIYNKGGIVAKSVTMIYNSNKTLFDFEHPELAIPAYTYVPSQPDFTFLVDFTKNDTTNIKNVKLHVFTSDGEVTVLDAVYDGKQDKFVASNKFYTNNLPENVSVSFDDETKYYLLREDVDRMYEKYHALYEQLNSTGLEIASINSKFHYEIKKISECGITINDLKHYQAIVLDDKSIIYLLSENDYIILIDSSKDLYVKVQIARPLEAGSLSRRATPLSVYYKAIDLYIEIIEHQGDLILRWSETLEKKMGEIQRILNLGPEDVTQFISVELAGIAEMTIDATDKALLSNLGNALGIISAAITALQIPSQLRMYKETMVEWKDIIKGIDATDCPKQKNKLEALKFAAYSSALLTGKGLEKDLLATEASIACAVAACFTGGISTAVGAACGIGHTFLYNGILALDATAKGSIRSQLPGLKGGPDCVDDDDDPDPDTPGPAPDDPDPDNPDTGTNPPGPDDDGSPFNGGDNQDYDPENPENSMPADPDHPDIPFGPNGGIGGIPATPPTNNGDKGKGKSSHPSPATPNVPYTIDPSGYVYEAVSSNRLEGVTVTCYQKRTEEDMYGDKYDVIEKWDAEQYSQKNPLITDQNGFYAWDVPQGLWQVKYEKDGYETVFSEWLPVPPPQLDINIGMQHAVAPEVTGMRGYESGIVVDMSKYMRPQTMTAQGSITVMRNGLAEKGHVELLNAEKDPYDQSREFVSKVKFVPNTAFNITDNVVVTVHKQQPESYCGMKMTADVTQTVPIEPEIKAIVCDSVLTVRYGQTTEAVVQVLPADAARGKTLHARSSSPMIASLANGDVEIGSDGKAILAINGDLPGGASLQFTIDNVDLTATAHISVEMPAGEVEAPTTSIPNGETVPEGTLLTLSTKTEGATIWYTTDGSCPCDEAKRIRYTEPIVITSDVTIKAIAVKDGMDDSDIVTYIYSVTADGIAETKTDLHFKTTYSDGQLTIAGAKGCTIRVYDLLGRELAFKRNADQTVIVKVPRAETYIVTVTTKDGQTLVRKLIAKFD